MVKNSALGRSRTSMGGWRLAPQVLAGSFTACLARSVLTLCATALGTMDTAIAGEPATSQRPSFSVDTSTTASGSIEVEAGYAWDNGGSGDAPLVVKLGMGAASELFVGWSPYRHVDTPRGRRRGTGDVVVGARHRFLEQDGRRPSAAFLLATKLPAADEEDDLGSGATDAFLGATVMHGGDRLTFLAYYQAAVFRRPDRPGTDVEHALALAAASPIDFQAGAFMEITGFGGAGAANDLLAQVGVGLTVAPEFVLDGSAGAAFGPGRPTWLGTVGLTANFGVLFHALR